MKELKPIWNFLKEERLKLIVVGILILLSETICLYTVYLNSSSFDYAIKGEYKLALINMGLFFIIGGIISIIIPQIYKTILSRIENELAYKLSADLYNKSLNITAKNYEKLSTGNIMNRIMWDSRSFIGSLGDLFTNLASIIAALLIFIYILLNSYIIALEIIIFLVIYNYTLKVYRTNISKLSKEINEEEIKYQSHLSETVRGIREIKTLGIKNSLMDETREIVKLIFEKNNNETNLERKSGIINGILKLSLEVVSFVTCIILLYYKKIDLVFFFAMTKFIYRYTWLIQSTKAFAKKYEQTIESFKRINEIYNEQTYEMEKFGKQKLHKCKGNIELKNVTFGYDENKIILNNLNLKIHPHKKVALVGKSGQGKTTIFNLITKLFTVKNGEVLIDNININKISEKELRKNISIIRQEPFLFNKTILENFKIIDKNVSLYDIRKYCKKADIDSYIMSLPDKYDTKLGEDGIILSGGQKQRIAIARSLLKESKIILFDEATSSLDNSSQDNIKNTINKLIKTHTVVIIAHRLSTIIDADLIYVIDNGKVLSSGNHNELLDNCSLYKELYSKENKNDSKC